MPAVSVIIPIHNADAYLAECLASIECQSLRDIEVICVDDASTDASAVLVQTFAAEDHRFKLFELQGDTGASAARNAGIDKATGDYLVFMDSDDWYPSSAVLERLYRAAIESGANIVGGSFSEYDERTGSVTVDFSGRGHQECYQFKSEGMVDYRDWQGDIGFHRFMFKRSFVVDRDLRYPPFIRYEDPVFLVKAMLMAGSFYAVPDVVYRYRANHKVLELSPKALDDAVEAHAELLVIAANNDLGQLKKWVIESLTWHLATQGPEAQAVRREADLVRQSRSYRLGNAIIGPLSKLRSSVKRRLM